LLLLAAMSNATAAEPYDVLLRNGRVVDGAATPWYIADVGLRDGRIAAIGRLGDAPARRVIDAAGLVVAPGFIDLMGQTATPFLSDPAAAVNLLAQGITTINAGEGDSAAPLAGDAARQAGWSTMAEYFARLEQAGLPLNVVQTVGHTQVRRVVLGEVDRRALPAELEKMQAHVREAMRSGAIGLSTALIYPPAVYAPTEEIAELARVAGEHGGGYFTHMRNEGDRLLEGIDEALAIGEAGGTRVHIFHLKAAGAQNWPRMDEALARIRSARAQGRQVAADIYPYINNGLSLTAFIHPRHAAQGRAELARRLDDPETRAEIRREIETRFDYENWYRHASFDWGRVVLGELKSPPYNAHNGKPLAEIARALGKDPWEVFFEACRLGAFALPQTMAEANLVKALREEFVSFCTDVGPAGGSSIASHPRAFGAFPRVLGRYVRELGAVSLERAVSQMSAGAANEVFQYDRGRLAVGLAADIAVFDPARIIDRATFAEPGRLPEGMRFVLVNGVLVLDEGKFTRAKPGRVLRGPGYQPKGS
jgi:N-acyl-D-aspartate/D-glutamate deacylase